MKKFPPIYCDDRNFFTRLEFLAHVTHLCFLVAPNLINNYSSALFVYDVLSTVSSEQDCDERNIFEALLLF